MEGSVEFFQSSLYQVCKVTDFYYNHHKCNLTNTGTLSPHECNEVNVTSLSLNEMKSWCYYGALYHVICPIRTTFSQFIFNEEFISKNNLKLQNHSFLCENSIDHSSFQENIQSPSFFPSLIPSTTLPTFDPTILRFELFFSDTLIS